MVLINNLTIDEINAALLHLQRARTEVVGGTKGSTVQNITISNKGGGSTVDYAPTITALSNRIDKNTDDIESVEDEIDKIQETLEQLSDNGISSMTFDPVTRQLQINTQDGEVYSCDITSENITLNFDATTNKLTLEMGEQYQEVTLPYINENEKGSANGVATLDSSGRVPYSQLPESAMEFLGNWNASTNTPHLQDGTGTNGDFYVCSVGGTVTFGTGNTQTFVPNDRVIYNGASSQWVKLPAGQVSSVNGMSGDVTLTASNIEYSTGVTIKDKIDANAVQSDWNVTDTTSLAYIKNKPTIPASPVQSDWNVTDTTSLAYIKNKPSVAVLGNTVGCALGTASAGSCTTAARSDHVHPLPICVQTGGYLGERAALGRATNCTYGVANVWNYCSDSRYYLIGTKYDNPSCKYNVRVDYATNATTSCCTKYLYACDGTSLGVVAEGGNEFNFKNISTPHMWLNWRGGVSNVIIGSGNSDGCCGTLRAALYCGGVADAGNGTATTFAYSKQGLQSNPSWLAAWNGYELRAVSPSVVCVACADHATCADCACRADKANRATCISGELYCSWDWIGACGYVLKISDFIYRFTICGITCEQNYFESFCRFVCSLNTIYMAGFAHSLTAIGGAESTQGTQYNINSVCWDSDNMNCWSFHGVGGYKTFRPKVQCTTGLRCMSFIVGL